jgi:hypothetical protein
MASGIYIITDPIFDYCLSQGFVGYWLVSSVKQAFDSYLGGPLNGETFPRTTGGTQPLCLITIYCVYFDIINTHCTLCRGR